MDKGVLIKKKRAHLSDTSLLRSMVERNDRVAFEKLMQRYGRTAYNLALRICGNAQMAEDAVQEVLLSLWRRAPSFDPRKGSVRTWILRIVALRSLQMRRQKQRDAKRVGRHFQRETPRTLRSESMDVEHKETLVSMREQLDRLPDADRALVALYYGADLSQQEISRQLAMPQRTVSHRLKLTLERLKKGLSQAGLALAAPGLEEGLLSDAVCTGHEMPPRLWQALSESFNRCGAELSGAGAPSFLSGSMKGALLPALALVTALSVPGVMHVVSSRPQADPTPPAPRVQKSVPVSTPAAQRTPLSREWTFENGWTSELKILRGEWRNWLPAKGKKRAMMVAPNGHGQVILALPVVQQKRPMEVRVIANMEKNSTGGVAFQWNAERADLVYLKDRSMKGTRLDYAAYFVDRYMLHYLNGRLIRIKVYERSYPSTQIFLRNNGLGIEKISVKELSVAELPPACREAEKHVRRFSADTKTWCRVGPSKSHISQRD